VSSAENVTTLPHRGGGNYDVTRFNALRHGVLSQHTVLPWEDGAEYSTLLEALVAEHKPQGPTEEHLIEELAGVIWRKRRLRLGECAVHHHALKRAFDPDGETARAAVINLIEDIDADCIGDAIRTTDEQTAGDTADLEQDQAMTEEALRILADSSPTAYSRALAALRTDTHNWWEEQLVKIRMRLSGEPGIALTFPARPKGMHRKTYQRLQSAASNAEILAQERLVIALARLLPRSDRRNGRRSTGRPRKEFWT